MKENTIVSYAAVTGKRQITIPKDVCDILNINVGDKVIFKGDENKITFERDKSLDNCELIMQEPMKYNFVIPFHLLSDAFTMKNITLSNEIFRMANEAINSGGKVIVQKEYINSKPEIMNVFTSLDELEKMKNKFIEIENMKK